MTNEMNRKDELAYEIYTDFQNGTVFIDQFNLRRDISRCINFNEGVQWNMDADIEEFPKIVLNVVKQFGKVRKSNVLQNEYGFLVKSSSFGDIRKIQDFIKYQHDKMNLRKKDLKILNDTYTKGTGIMYMYWDADSRGLLSKSGGELKAEAIDVRRFRVADPYIQDLQEQEYVIYVSRERVNSIEKKYGVRVASDAEILTQKTEKTISSRDEKHEFVNVYTKFYRNNEGQVFFVISTQDVVLKQPTALNPFYNDGEIENPKYGETEKKSKEEEPNTTSLMDNIKVDDKIKHAVFNKYPFASLVLDERDNCFYGIPGALEVLESQKSINQHFSVYDKGVADNVLGGFVYKRGILGDQEITTENGQTIELDLLPGEKWQEVFGRLPVNTIPADSLNYSGNLLNVLKQVSGATNVQIGQADYAGQSGKATEMLLQRAKENTTDQAMLFNEYKKEQAELIFLFSKFYFDNEEFSVVHHGSIEDNIKKYEGDNKYNGNNYLEGEVIFDIKVGPSPAFSEYTNIELLGMMVQSGQAPLEVYISSLPDGYVSNKQEMLKLLENNSQKTIEALQQQLEQATAVMQEMNKAFKETEKDRVNIDTIIRDNERLRTMLADLAAGKIGMDEEATEQNRQMTEDMARLVNIAAKNSGNK